MNTFLDEMYAVGPFLCPNTGVYEIGEAWLSK